jgi:hypothetical protein
MAVLASTISQKEDAALVALKLFIGDLHVLLAWTQCQQDFALQHAKLMPLEHGGDGEILPFNSVCCGRGQTFCKR